MRYGRLFLLWLSLLPVAFGGCAILDDSPASPDKGAARFDDAGIKTEITASLLKTDAAKSNDINVRCYQGHVFLIGEADGEFREKALEVAKMAEGVVHVTTHWFPTGTADPVLDATVEQAIDKAGIIGAGQRPRFVSVDCWGGHVVLTGLSRNQGTVTSVVEKIRAVPQVKSVTSYITVLGEKGGR